MRPFEITILLVMALFGAMAIAGIRPGIVAARMLAAFTAAAIGAHLLLEGGRIHMVPALVVTVLFAGLALRRKPDPIESKSRLRAVGRVTLRYLLLPIAVGVAWLLPAAILVPELPSPSGPYPVGVTDFDVEFEGRPEILTEEPNDVRRLAVRAWYPTEASGATPEPYFTREEQAAFLDLMNTAAPGSGVLFRQGHLATTHSVRNAPIRSASNGFPVVVYSHGYGLFSWQNTPLMEELASHGFVVFSLAHTWDGLSMFRDGQVALLGSHIEAMAAQARDDEMVESVLANLQRLTGGRSEEERREALRIELERARDDRRAGLGTGVSGPVWIEDRLRFFDVLEELQDGSRASIFPGRLDLSRIGLAGMSFGGATAAEVCHLDERCGAAVNLDGGHWFLLDTELLDGEIRSPLLMVHADDTTHSAPVQGNPGDYRSMSDFFYESPPSLGTRSDVVRFRIDGTNHGSFTDMALMARWIPGLASETPGRRVAEIVSAYVLAFFESHLLGKRSSLLDAPSRLYPEVTWQTFGRPLSDP